MATTWGTVEDFIADIATLQEKKVLDLARRLKPGLTAEDIANPHDFPELDDADWQFEAGTLAGIHSVLMAVRAKRRDVGE